MYEGDGLPSQICYKCHNKLDIAYQFKQQCEAADAHIRQILNRSSNEKSPSINIDLTQVYIKLPQNILNENLRLTMPHFHF